MSDLLLESQPAVRVSALVLRQWYAQYHPASGSLRFATADALEEGMGDELRARYAGLKHRALATALSQRRKVVDVSRTVCSVWLEKYAAAEKGRPGKRPRLAAPSVASSSGMAPKLFGFKAIEEERHSYRVCLRNHCVKSMARVFLQ